MRIVITCPNVNSIHGGIRVILEWANHLHDLGHHVTIFDQAKRRACKWFPVKVPIANNSYVFTRCDCLIVTSPHGVEYFDKPIAKKFGFVQMMEHHFRPDNRKWVEMCAKFYQTPFPMFSISHWNIQEMTTKWGRIGPTHYIGNGINLHQFPILEHIKDYKTILIESPQTSNPSKDPDLITLKVAKRLKADGYKVIGYGANPLTIMTETVDEYYVKPELGRLNSLYQRATILLKATKMDARSTSPIEAMTKGTVTVRAIEMGDDDLTMENSYRCLYNEQMLYDEAKIALSSHKLTDQKAKICLEYAQQNTWDKWINKINQIITQ